MAREGTQGSMIIFRHRSCLDTVDWSWLRNPRCTLPSGRMEKKCSYMKDGEKGQKRTVSYASVWCALANPLLISPPSNLMLLIPTYKMWSVGFVCSVMASSPVQTSPQLTESRVALSFSTDAEVLRAYLTWPRLAKPLPFSLHIQSCLDSTSTRSHRPRPLREISTAPPRHCSVRRH